MALDISQRAILTYLRVTSYSGERVDRALSDSIDQTADAEPGTGKFSKKIIDPTQIKKIKATARKLRRTHERMTLPWGNQGQRILPIMDYAEYVDALSAAEGEFWQDVDAFIKGYDPQDPAHAKRLGELYNPADYPDVDQIKRRFEVRQMFTPVPNVDDFRVNLDQATITQLKANLTSDVDQEAHTLLEELMHQAEQQLPTSDEEVRGPTRKACHELADRIDKFNFVSSEQAKDYTTRLRAV